MNEVEGLDSVTAVDDTRDIDLVCALADHLNVDVPLRERREHAPRDADHVAHQLSDHREDRHIAMHGYLDEKKKIRGSGKEGRDRGGEKWRNIRYRFFLNRAQDAPAACDRARPRSPC